MKKFPLSIASAGVLFAMASTNAFAAVDISAITGAFEASDIIAGVMAIAGTLALVYVAMKAATTVLGMLRGR